MKYKLIAVETIVFLTAICMAVVGILVGVGA